MLSSMSNFYLIHMSEGENILLAASEQSFEHLKDKWPDATKFKIGVAGPDIVPGIILSKALLTYTAIHYVEPLDDDIPAVS